MTSTSLDAGVEETVLAPGAPTRLRVEHLREAMGITNTRPRFSWTLPPGTGPAATTAQAAYRITASNGWDTGRVASGQHNLVPYSRPGTAVAQPV
jgi:alpha-L-rhamnosidase